MAKVMSGRFVLTPLSVCRVAQFFLLPSPGVALLLCARGVRVRVRLPPVSPPLASRSVALFPRHKEKLVAIPRLAAFSPPGSHTTVFNTAVQNANPTPPS